MPSSAISTFGRSAFLYAFFIEQPHNTGTIARTANNIFSYVSPLSIFLCYLLLHILMRKQGRDSRGCLLGISTQTAQIGKIGRDSRANLLEFSTQMAQNSEKGRDSRGCFLRISTQTAEIGKIGRDSKLRRPPFLLPRTNKSISQLQHVPLPTS